MNDAERRVLRRWRVTLADSVQVTPALLERLKARKLLTDDKLRQITVCVCVFILSMLLNLPFEFLIFTFKKYIFL